MASTTTVEISQLALQATLYGSAVMFVRHFAAVLYDGLAGTAAGYRAPEDEKVLQYFWFIPGYDSKQNFGSVAEKSSVIPQSSKTEINSSDPQKSTWKSTNELEIENKKESAKKKSSEMDMKTLKKLSDEQMKLSRLEERKARGKRILGNDMENVPFGLIIAWGGLLCGGNPEIHAAGVGIFVVGRVLFTFTYMAGLQPWRSISFVIGMAGTVMILANAIAGVEA